MSNALPELVHGGGRGARFELRKIPLDETGMSPKQIWCNESQERYVLAIAPERLAEFRALCERERCPFAVVGVATAEDQLTVHDKEFGNYPVDMPLSVLLGKPPKMTRNVVRETPRLTACDTGKIELREAIERVLRLPSVANKTFLISIGDRTVGGMTARDQMVGPWQVPVADVAVTLMGFNTNRGEAFAIGERTPLALVNAPASGRMAVGEAITNIAAARIDKIGDIKLSANWMAAAGHHGEDAALFDTVRAVGMELCPQLGISIPVGKDSMSMKTVWQDGEEKKSVTAPLSLIVTAFAPTPRCARNPDAAACAIHGYHAVADRSGPGKKAHGRFGAGAGIQTGRRCCAGCRRCAAAQGILRADTGAERRGQAVQLSRPLRWRRVRDTVRNGIRRPHRGDDTA